MLHQSGIRSICGDISLFGESEGHIWLLVDDSMVCLDDIVGVYVIVSEISAKEEAPLERLDDLAAADRNSVVLIVIVSGYFLHLLRQLLQFFLQLLNRLLLLLELPSKSDRSYS